MPSGAAVALLLECLTAAASVWGLVRLERLHAVAPDARLRRLSWVFGLFAAAMVLQAGSTLAAAGRAAASSRLPAVLELGYHVTFLAALVVALTSFWPRRTEAASTVPAAAILVVPTAARLAPGALLAGPFGVPGLLEAILALVLAILAVRNSARRRRASAWLVAAGYALVFLAHAAFWTARLLGAAPRPFWAEALLAVGVLLLVLAVPRRTLPAGSSAPLPSEPSGPSGGAP